MNKEEFLEILENQLAGQMDGREIASNLQYYSSYIESRVRQGHTEEEVLTELGDPRLIARTLLEVEDQGGSGASYEGVVYEESGDDVSSEDSGGYYGEDRNYGGGFYEEEQPADYYGEDSGTYSQDPYAQDEGYIRRRSYHLDLSTWYGKAVVIVIAGLVIAGLVLLLGLMIPVALAIVGISLVIYFLTHLFRR